MKKDPVRNVGKTTLALIALAVCSVTFVLVDLPVMYWMLGLVQPMGWLEGGVGAFVGILIFTLSCLPTLIMYYFVNERFEKLTADGDE